MNEKCPQHGGSHPPWLCPDRSQDIVALVQADLEQRADLGQRKYGERLTTNIPPQNGKSALQNAYEEVLDLACYLRKELANRGE